LKSKIEFYIASDKDDSNTHIIGAPTVMKEGLTHCGPNTK